MRWCDFLESRNQKRVAKSVQKSLFVVPFKTIFFQNQKHAAYDATSPNLHNMEPTWKKEISFWDIRFRVNLFQTGKGIKSNWVDLAWRAKPPPKPGFFSPSVAGIFPKMMQPSRSFTGNAPEKGGCFKTKRRLSGLGSPVTFCWGELVGRISRHISVDIGSLVLAESRLPNWSTDCILGVRKTRVSVEVIVTN